MGCCDIRVWLRGGRNRGGSLFFNGGLWFKFGRRVDFRSNGLKRID